jgi:glycosyltransferase involved in cell wall biosynthesis
MRVVWAGTFDPEFSRNKKLARLMDMSGIEVRSVRETVWSADRIALAGRPSLRVAVRALIAYPVLLVRLLQVPTPDLYLVTYPGWFDVPVVRLVATLRRRQVVFDPFLSLHDTMISDRALHSHTSLVARFARLIDRLSLRLADFVIADTYPQLELYEALSGGLRRGGGVLEVGADDQVFVPHAQLAPEPNVVLYYGKLIPLHGVRTIVEAAGRLRSDDVRMVMIGDGPERQVLEEAMRQTGAVIERHGMLALEELPAHVARASICLGVFGGSDKAGRVIPHKVYEAMAMRRPVITRDGPAVRSTFPNGDVVTVPPDDPVALAEAIQSLLADGSSRDRIAAAGYESYRRRFHERPLASALLRILEARI